MLDISKRYYGKAGPVGNGFAKFLSEDHHLKETGRWGRHFSDVRGGGPYVSEFGLVRLVEVHNYHSVVMSFLLPDHCRNNIHTDSFWLDRGQAVDTLVWTFRPDLEKGIVTIAMQNREGSDRALFQRELRFQRR